MASQRLTRGLQTVARQSSQAQAFRTPRSPFQSQQLAAPISSQWLSGRRWYSDAPEADAKKAEDAQASAKTGEAKTEDPATKELEATKKELEQTTDHLKRQVADYRNLQLQTKREVQAAKDFAIQRFAKDLIESIDNLDRALTTVPADKLTDSNQDLVNLHSGLTMTEKILMATLKKHGLERVDPSVEGEKFDPNVHEAMFMAPQPGKEDGTVFFTQQKGFMLNGRVVRPTKVGVVKNS